MLSVHVSRLISRARATAATATAHAVRSSHVSFRAQQPRCNVGNASHAVQSFSRVTPTPPPPPTTTTTGLATPYRATSSILFPCRHFTSTSTSTSTSKPHVTSVPMQARAFSSEGVEPTRDFNAMKRAKSTYEEWKPRVKTYVIIATVFGGFYIIYSVAKWTIDFFASINFAEVGEVAFVAGLLSGFAIVFTGWLGTRFLVLRPEPIYKAILRRILNESTVQAELGTELKVGSFRAYSFSDGGIRWQAEKGVTYSGWDRYWKPRKLQLFFQVSGPRGHGMVSAEVEKNLRGQQKYNVLAVDILDTGKHVVLEGDPTRALYQGVIRLR